MASILKHVQGITIAFVVIAGGFLHAEYEEDCCPQICCPEPCSGKIFFDIEALYLRAYEGGLSNVCNITNVSETLDEGGGVTSLLTAKGQDPRFKWNWGFRLGAGYDFSDCSCGGARAYWTHYHSNKTPGCRYKWKLDFDVADFLYRMNCACSSCFTVTPYAGIRYARIDQKLRTHFLSQENETLVTALGSVKQDFDGFGPLIGVEGDWGVSCGLSVYGNVSIGVLYGNTHISSNRFEEFDERTNIDFKKDRKNAYQYVVDAGIGVRWKKCFCNDKLLVVQLGFENHSYFNHNQFGGNGDLSLDGLTLGFSLEY